MKIGELSERTGVPTKTIRYYEDIGLLPAPNREFNGYRSYGEEGIQRLQFVQHARAAGLTLREIGQVLEIRSQGRAPCVHVRDLLRYHLEQIEVQVAELKAAKRELERLAIRAAATDPANCQEGDICTILVQNNRVEA